MGTRRAVAVSWILTVVAAAAAGVFLVLGPGRPLPDDLLGGVAGAAFLLVALAYGTVGALIAFRLPGHRVGWLYSLIGLLTAVSGLAYAYASYALFAADLPLGVPAVLVWSGLELTAPLLVLALLLLPDGRLPSRRWRPAAGLLLAAAVIMPAARLFPDGTLEDPFGIVANPLGIPGTRGELLALDGLGWVLTMAGTAAAVALVCLRLRRATGEERQQLKWVLSVTAAAGVLVAANMVLWWVAPGGHLQERMAGFAIGFGAIPVSAGFAILRYRLYDIDVVIDWALVYGALTVLLAATYVAIALALGTALGSGSPPATAAATLAVALAFGPLRRRLQAVVDRRFNRARYDAVQRMAGFLEDVRAGRAAPEDVQVMLRELVDDPALELRYVLPDGRRVDARGAPVHDDPADPRRRTQVRRAGATIAEVLHGARPELVRPVVERAELALEIVRLRVELRRRLDEVAASRRRIVTAADEERRRIERDLHDGAQQRLVSIGLLLRHAQHELGPASRTGDMLDRATGELTVAIRELRDLAQGLRPPQLDAGLGLALEELAGRVPLPVAVDATSERFPPGVESAAYFIACEGITNAAKHADASRILLSAQRRNGTLVVSVADDGVGGATPALGSGLRGLADRVGAHGGVLRIDSADGAGTTLTAELPCES